jgi:hypothetical protein
LRWNLAIVLVQLHTGILFLDEIGRPPAFCAEPLLGSGIPSDDNVFHLNLTSCFVVGLLVLGVIGASMECKLLIALKLKVPFRFIVRFASERVEGLKTQAHSEQPQPRKRCCSIHTSFRLMAAPPIPI